jgi:uncharacterized protein
MQSLIHTARARGGAAALAVLLAGLLPLCTGCNNPPYPRGAVEQLFPNGPKPELRTIEVEHQPLHYAQMTGPGTTPLLFIHGSPGDWQAWAAYLNAPQLQAYGPRIAVDRPGFGGSLPGQVMTDLRAQARRIAAVLPAARKAIVVGHSLGGPLAAWIAIDHPERVCGVVMVAGSTAAELEAPRWYNRVAATWLAQRLLRDELVWSNHEMMALQPQLQQLDGQWSRLRVPLIAVQGQLDHLVDPRSAERLERAVAPQWLTVIRVPDQGHFVLWQAPQVVIDAITALPCPPS